MSKWNALRDVLAEAQRNVGADLCVRPFPPSSLRGLRSRTKQPSRNLAMTLLGCFVATLLAMTELCICSNTK